MTKKLAWSSQLMRLVERRRRNRSRGLCPLTQVYNSLATSFKLVARLVRLPDGGIAGANEITKIFNSFKNGRCEKEKKKKMGGKESMSAAHSADVLLMIRVGGRCLIW